MIRILTTSNISIRHTHVYAWKNLHPPSKVLSGSISSIAAGVSHCTAISNGKLYGWGLNFYGQTGYFKSNGSVVKFFSNDDEVLF